jgi:hypothetical protein
MRNGRRVKWAPLLAHEDLAGCLEKSDGIRMKSGCLEVGLVVHQTPSMARVHLLLVCDLWIEHPDRPEAVDATFAKSIPQIRHEDAGHSCRTG